ncbi:uncharacterized protein LOC143151688 [Ptiloglossa arizonensis]|uniref:uncharacterized protein LOC143151688 n=1 Tax=Ptiloglossa arizonensis TaxID=3350558 RepID=UPI003FA0FA79
MQGLPATSGVHTLPSPRVSRSPRINPYLVTASLTPPRALSLFPLRHARLSLARAFFCLWSNSQHPSARSGLQSMSRTRHRRNPKDPSTATDSWISRYRDKASSCPWRIRDQQPRGVTDVLRGFAGIKLGNRVRCG